MGDFFNSFPQEMFYLLRVLAALVFGFAIGFERKLRYKEAGIRTHAIVAAGSCLIMVISKYGFTDVAQGDAARLAAQIVTGIGFLGAGIIIYKKEALHGLTTAAGIWMTAGVGMAVGAGLYWLAAGATILIIALQCFMHLPIKLFAVKKFYLFRVKFKCDGGGNEQLKKIFNVKEFTKINLYNDGGETDASADIRTDKYLDDDVLSNLVRENTFIRSIERIEE